MGLAATHYRVTTESIRNGEGGIDQMKRAAKLIEDMKTSVPDFREHSAVYTQLAKYLAKDENCTSQDVQNAYSSIKDALKENGKNANDTDVISTFNKFKSLVRNNDVNQLFQKANLKTSDITELLAKCANENFDKNAIMDYLQSKQDTTSQGINQGKLALKRGHDQLATVWYKPAVPGTLSTPDAPTTSQGNGKLSLDDVLKRMKGLYEERIAIERIIDEAKENGDKTFGG